MKAEPRHIALAAALLATLAATAWTSRRDVAVDAADTSTRPLSTAIRRAPAGSPVSSDPLRPARAEFRDAVADPFAARSWAPTVAEKPPAPSAPPLPFTYFGRMTEDGKHYVFLQRGERSYTATAGESLDPQYRVEAITPDTVVFTYLPLKQRQVLHTGG